MTDIQLLSEQMNRIEAMLFASKRVFTIQEASVFTNLTERTIYKKTSLGEIPHYKQAGKLYFDRLELENWLLEKRGFCKDDIRKAAATYCMKNPLKR